MRAAGSEDEGLGALFEAALAARRRAYAPYSRFSVGAALRDETGALHAGCNVENAAYPVGTCAEAGAIAAMIAAGAGGSPRSSSPRARRGRAGDALRRLPPAHPRIRRPDTPVFAAGPGGVLARHTLDALLPASFGPETLS